MIDHMGLPVSDFVASKRFYLEALKPLGASSKLNAEWAFLTHLHDLGRQTADAWLDRHFTDLGVRSTIDLHAMFRNIGPQHNG